MDEFLRLRSVGIVVNSAMLIRFTRCEPKPRGQTRTARNKRHEKKTQRNQATGQVVSELPDVENTTAARVGNRTPCQATSLSQNPSVDARCSSSLNERPDTVVGSPTPRSFVNLLLRAMRPRRSWARSTASA